MATPLDMEWLKRYVECSICLQMFENPKLLKCSHQFCKECLEDVLVFREDGSATVQCPMRCTTQTIISADKTINDLSACYEFRGILEDLKAKDQGMNVQIPVAVCGYGRKCTRDASVYCCGIIMCKACSTNHEKTKAHCEHQRTTNLFFNKKDKKLSVLCENHVSQCTHLCVDGKFLCAYCMKRDKEHATHAKNTIERDIELIKEALVDGSRKVEGIYGFLKATKEGIVLTKKKFDNLLRRRKEECLSLYNDFLRKEEEMLKSKFQSICENHLKQYSDIDPVYYQDKLGKLDVELAIQKEEILDLICKNEKKSSLSCIVVSLSQKFNFLSEQPFGDVEFTIDESVSVSNLPVTTLKYNIKSNIRKDTTIQTSHGLSTMPSSTTGKTSTIADKDRTYSTCEKNIVNSPSRKVTQAYFDITIDGTTSGRIVIDLFPGVVPETCTNFVQLCTHEQGFGYKGSKFHLINPGKCLVGGDITNGDGSGGRSIHADGKFQYENFIMKHNSKGIISMRDVKNTKTYNSQFIISMKPKPEFDGKHVAFGKVTNETLYVVEKINCVNRTWMEPAKDVIIVGCGIL